VPDAGVQLEFSREVFGSGIWTSIPTDAAFVDPCTNCAYLTPTATRVVKVGNFAEGPTTIFPLGFRYDYDASNREIYLGFRCARAPR